MNNSSEAAFKQTTLQGRSWTKPTENHTHEPLRPLPLRKQKKEYGSTYLLSEDFEYWLKQMGFDHVLYLDFALDSPEDGEVPLLIATPITDRERQKARCPRKIMWSPEHGAEVCVPTRFLDGEGTAEVGLGLRLDTYSNDDKLIFDALPMAEFFALLPVKYDSGAYYEYVPPRARV